MTAIQLNGREVANQLQEELALKVKLFKERANTVPGLVVILVGDDPASQVYVRNKEQSAIKAGFHLTVERLDKTVSQEELLLLIEKYNRSSSCHAILVQLPLPKHLDEQTILQAIDSRKDVDGFHPTNVGNFVLGNPSTIPCTPYGVMTLLNRYDISCAGKLAVVVGRSNIVGKPMAQLLLNADATVMIVHSKTKNLQELTRQADILVVAVGRGHLITPDYVKEGAIVVDVGMNRNEEGKLIGDVHTDVFEKASYMTPVPGGVGPMTIAMLMQQVFDLAQRTAF